MTHRGPFQPLLFWDSVILWMGKMLPLVLGPCPLAVLGDQAAPWLLLCFRGFSSGISWIKSQSLSTLEIWPRMLAQIPSTFTTQLRSNPLCVKLKCAGRAGSLTGRGTNHADIKHPHARRTSF